MHWKFFTGLALVMGMKYAVGQGNETESGEKGPTSMRQKNSFCPTIYGLGSYPCDEKTGNRYGCDGGFCWRSCFPTRRELYCKSRRWCYQKAAKKYHAKMDLIVWTRLDTGAQSRQG